MKHSLWITGLLIFVFHQARAQHYFTAKLSERDIAVWAHKQHSEIVLKIFPVLQQGKVTPYTETGQPMNLESALALFAEKEEAYKNYKFTIPITPQIPDTSYWVQTTWSYRHTFIVSSTTVKVFQWPVINFRKADLYKVLSEDNCLYLELFAINDTVKFKNIPQTSRAMLTSINAHLYSVSKSPDHILYKNDSMNRYLDLEEKRLVGTFYKSAWIQTNPNDPTEGYDSIFPIGFAVVDDTSIFQAIFFSINMQGFSMQVKGIGCGLPSMQSDTTERRYYPGFLLYSRRGLLKDEQISLLETALRFRLIFSMQYDGTGYMNDYGIYQYDFR